MRGFLLLFIFSALRKMLFLYMLKKGPVNARLFIRLTNFATPFKNHGLFYVIQFF